MTNKEYREHEGISKSQLSLIAKSPAHFKYAMDNPNSEDTPSLLFGRAVHKYILEKEDFDKEFAVAPSCDRRTKAGKEQYEAFLIENQGKDVISIDDMEKIKAMSDVIDSIPMARRLLQGEHEQSFFWTDAKTGEMVKCRPDCITKIGNTHILVDYKTTDNAETESFMKSAMRYSYDLQAGMYSEGMKICTDNDYQFVFVAQEKNPPYAVNILQADKYFMAEGNELFHSLLEIYHECKETGNWYGLMGEDENIGSLSLSGPLLKEYEIKLGGKEDE